MNPKTLGALLKGLQKLKIPEPKPRHTTVFDISKLSHHENTFSNWYQYFLDINNKYSTIFLECLFTLLKEQEVSIKFPVNWKINREEKVEGKRIDLVLESENKDTCLIIENKIWAKLYNDLVTYYKYKTECTQPPVGIVLSLCKIKTNHKAFYNILHKQWLDLVKEKIEADTSNEYFLFFHFYNAIINLQNEYTMNDQVSFFFENRDQILKANRTHAAARKYIKNQLNDIATNIGLDVSIAKDKYFHYFIPKFSAACIVVAIEDLDDQFEGGANIALQLKKEGILRKKEFHKELRLLIKDSELELEPWGPGKTHYLHYAVKYYDTQSLEFYSSIQKIVSEDLVNTFIPLLKKIHTILEEE